MNIVELFRDGTLSPAFLAASCPAPDGTLAAAACFSYRAGVVERVGRDSTLYISWGTFGPAGEAGPGAESTGSGRR